jgi:uncharacterized protein
MDLRERFSQDLKTAMKAGDKARLGTIRLIQAALKDRDIEARGAGKGQIESEEILALLQKMIKQRQESHAIYKQNDRADLAAIEASEMVIIQDFLPRQLDEAEIEAAISVAITETGASSVKDMGKVITLLKTHYTGQMDFAKASARVKAKLGQV